MYDETLHFLLVWFGYLEDIIQWIINGGWGGNLGYNRTLPIGKVLWNVFALLCNVLFPFCRWETETESHFWMQPHFAAAICRSLFLRSAGEGNLWPVGHCWIATPHMLAADGSWHPTTSGWSRVPHFWWGIAFARLWSASPWQNWEFSKGPHSNLSTSPWTLYWPKIWILSQVGPQLCCTRVQGLRSCFSILLSPSLSSTYPSLDKIIVEVYKVAHS